MGDYRVEFYYRPGLTRSQHECAELIRDCRAVAATCFAKVPDYQCLSDDPRELEDKVITVARAADGSVGGFCSAVLLPVYGIGEVFHLGLTCVAPFARSGGLTHKLTASVLTQYVLRHNPFGKTWISNVACVLSSLGNVATYFEDVYPSPLGATAPTAKHIQIAKAINLYYRKKVYIREDAELDLDNFVFRRSVAGTVFQKSANDARYRHRHDWLNQYYARLMQFDQGDEVLQIGYVTLLTAVKHKLKRQPLRPQQTTGFAEAIAPAI